MATSFSSREFLSSHWHKYSTHHSPGSHISGAPRVPHWVKRVEPDQPVTSSPTTSEVLTQPLGSNLNPLLPPLTSSRKVCKSLAGEFVTFACLSLSLYFIQRFYHLQSQASQNSLAIQTWQAGMGSVGSCWDHPAKCRCVSAAANFNLTNSALCTWNTHNWHVDLSRLQASSLDTLKQ